MLIAQMAINFHRQSAAVFVTEPARNRWHINAAFNAPRGKQVAQVMVGKTSDPQLLAGSIDCALAFMNKHYWFVRKFRLTAIIL